MCLSSPLSSPTTRQGALKDCVWGSKRGTETVKRKVESFREGIIKKKRGVKKKEREDRENKQVSREGRSERAQRMSNFCLWCHTRNQYLIPLSAMIRSDWNHCEISAHHSIPLNLQNHLRYTGWLAGLGRESLNIDNPPAWIHWG